MIEALFSGRRFLVLLPATEDFQGPHSVAEGHLHCVRKQARRLTAARKQTRPRGESALAWNRLRFI
jgi:hypothetical protein